MTDSSDTPKGEAADAVQPPSPGTFGDAAAEMPNETEVEVEMEPRSEDGRPEQPATEADGDISGVSDMIEEGAPVVSTSSTSGESDSTRGESDSTGGETGSTGGETGLTSGESDSTGGEAGSSDSDESVAADDELVTTQMALAERTADLQRLQAEFVNYKRRVDRDRDLIKENATYAALVPIVEVLDNIDRAREHGELDPGFKSIAEQLERVAAGSGLVKFGTPGDAFDPAFHEALSHAGQDPEVEVTTCKVVAKAGYKIGERVVRAAQVLVVDPVDPAE